VLLLKIRIQESGYNSIKNPYLPAGIFLPLMVASVVTEMVVHSSAPALQGDSTSDPKPRTDVPKYAMSMPQILPSLPLTPGAFYLI